MGDRSANEDNSVRALGSLVTDLALSYRLPHIEMYFRVENILNIEWNEAQFDTESRLRGPDENGKFMGTLETESISELNYTPGSPRFFRGGLVFHL
ncbi:MAG: TonB-dependent receptor [Calditrichia bacterium]|nr:TonB-dependent receptor [Calditrichia bacterium]